MKHEYRLGTKNPSIKKIMKSEQFEISEKILEMRSKLNLSVEEAADITGLTLEDYFNLEWVELNIPIEKYNYALDKLKSYDTLRNRNKKVVSQIVRYNLSQSKNKINRNKFKKYDFNNKIEKNENKNFTVSLSKKPKKNKVERKYVWHS